MIELSELYVGYGWRREPAVKGVTARFDGLHLLLGPNGSGKTTLFRAIAGLTPIASGRVLIDGVDASSIYGRPGLLSINLSEVYSVFRLSAYDHLRLYMDLTGGDADLALRILEDLGVSVDLLKRRRPWELSAGERKSFTTSIALSSRAKHVLLDEPFEQLDPARKARLMGYLKGHRGVLVLNTHETWLLPHLEGWRVHFMFEGRLYGDVLASELLDASLAPGEVPGALVRVEVSGRPYSVVKGGGGEPLTRIATLDRVYELAMGGSG